MTQRLFPIAVALVFASAIGASGLAAAQSKPNAKAEWDRILGEAKKEGKVVIQGPPFRHFGQALADGFQAAYGITLEYAGLPPGEAMARIDREMAAGRPSFDALVGGGTELLTMLPKGQLESIADKLLLPEVTDPSKWQGGHLKWFDAQKKYLLATTDWVMTDLFVNAGITNPASITSWKDLLKPEYKGKIAAYQPASPGPGQATAGYLYYKFGEKFVVDLYKGQNVTMVTDNRQLAEMVARGTHLVGIALVPPAIETFRKEGFKIERVTPKDGPGSMVGGWGVVKIVKGAPHPNAAIVFVNWFASKNGQEVYAKTMLEASRRTDVSPSLVPDYIVPKPGVKYDLDQYTQEWYMDNRPKVNKRLVEALGR